jgi:hypothetical protein
LGGLFETSYDLQDLTQLLEQFDLVVGSGAEGWAHALKKYVPIVIAYKKIVINDTTNLMAKEKWPSFLNFSTRVYSQLLYYNYFIKVRTVLSGSGLNSFDYLAEHSMALVTELANQRTVAEPSVSNEELTELLLSLKTAELIPAKISTDTIKKLVQVISGKIFADPIERLNGKIFKGITSAHTKTMLVEYHIWSDIQHAYEKTFFGSGNVELSPAELLVLLKKMDQTVAVKEAEQLYDSVLPLVTDDKMRILLPLNFKRYDYRSVSNLNLYRALARKVLQSYTGDIGRIFEYKGITEAEMQSFFADFKPLLENLGMIMPGNTNFATNRFLEANLFLPSSDGSDYLNLREGTQLLTMVFSGLEVNKQAEDQMGVQCLVPNANELTPPEKIESSPSDKMNIDCVVRFYWDHYQEVFSNLPEMTRFLKTLTPIQFHDFMFRMIKATGWKETPARIAFRADTSLLPHIMQYLEAVVLRYDADKNGILDDNEAEVALPVYAGLIRKFSGTAAYVANKAAFLYMLKNGKVPCGLGDVMPIFWKVVQGQKIGITADRMILSSVFGSIAEKVSGGASAQCPANGTTPPPPGGIPSQMFTPILGNVSPELSVMPILNFN